MPCARCLVPKAHKSNLILHYYLSKLRYYYFNANFKEAGKWYAKLFETTSENIEPEYYYRYSDCLKAEENYTTANQFLDKFSEKASSDSRAILYSKNKNYLNDIQTNSGRYEIEDAGINSELSDYGGFIYNDQLIFTSNRSIITWAKRKHSWTNQPLSKLYKRYVNEQCDRC